MVKRYTDLDINEVASNLKEYLKSQDKFKDYDFEGSGLSIIIDLLSYNTVYNAFYSNMIANEMFLDTATVRENINSRAKAIGYTPRSALSAQAIVNVTFDLSDQVSPPAFVEIPKYTVFRSRLDGKTYNFYTLQKYTLINNGAGIFTQDVEIYEGTLITHKFTVDTDIFPQQRFIIPNPNVDTTSLTVQVKESASSTTVVTRSLANDVTLVDRDDLVYFLQETGDGLSEVYFGDDIIGKSVENGNIVSLIYIATSADVVNGLNVFFAPTIGLYSASKYTIATIQAAQRGTVRETDESIKLLSPRFYESQNRAVNAYDYETLLLKDYPQIEAVRVWGGENNDPPRYGVVFVSAKPKDALVFNTQEKQVIVNQIIRPRNPVSIQVEIVDPEYMQIVIDTLVKYESRINNLDDGQVKSLVINAINQYADNNLSRFNSQFRYSKLVQSIDASDESVLGNLTEVKLKFGVIPALNIPTRIEFSFQSEIDLGDILHNISGLESTAFLKNGLVSYIADDGQGSLFIYRRVVAERVIVEQDIGTIDYSTGKITIPSLIVEGIVDGSETLYFIAKPAQRDFESVRNRILLIEENDITVNVENESV